ncbi:hypothetical protein JCM14076_27480 [Methylosoma difficile]
MAAMKSNLVGTPVLLVLVAALGFSGSPSAAVRDNNGGGGNAKIVAKLQSMVQDITAERDRLKLENEKVLADLDKLKKESEKDKAAVVAEKESLDQALAAQKTSTDDLQGRLEATTVRLKEVIEKYNALNKSKAELTAQHGNLSNKQQMTSSELKTCEAKNVKLYQVSKEIIEGYKSCQNRGIIDTLVDSEPVLQINNVEFETLMQEFEDKLNKQKYAPKDIK